MGVRFGYCHEVKVLLLASWHNPEEADQKKANQNVMVAAREKLTEQLSLRLNALASQKLAGWDWWHLGL